MKHTRDESKTKRFRLTMADIVIGGVTWNEAMDLLTENGIYPILFTEGESGEYRFYMSSKGRSVVATMVPEMDR